MNFDSVTVTHMRSHISLFSTAVGETLVLLLGVVKSNREHGEDHRMSLKVEVIFVTLWMSRHFLFLSAWSPIALNFLIYFFVATKSKLTNNIVKGLAKSSVFDLYVSF